MSAREVVSADQKHSRNSERSFGCLIYLSVQGKYREISSILSCVGWGAGMTGDAGQNKTGLALWAERLGFLIAVGAVFSGGYWLGQRPGSEQTQVYKDFVALDLPSRIKELSAGTQALNKAAKEFSKMLVENRTYEEIRANFDKVAQSASDRLAENEKLREELSALQRKWADLTDVGKAYSVKEAAAVPVIGGQLIVGAKRVLVDGQAVLNLNGTEKTVYAGDVFEFNVPGRGGCTIRINSVDFISSSITFNADCREAVQE
jgi:hypothetical protein